MNPTLRNILAVILGLISGMIVNGLIIKCSASLIPLPPGVDPNNIESIKANMHLYETKHFLMPFLAHALGTLVGAFIAAKIALGNTFAKAIIIGLVFLAGGIWMIILLPQAPLWFKLTDAVLAYLPMAWLGNFFANIRK